MKKRILMPVLVMLILVGCLDSLDFDPRKALPEISVTGNVDVTDVTSAVLMISNVSRTIAVTRVVISHYEGTINGEDIFEPIAQFNDRPRPLTIKTQYVKPSHDEYKIEIYYRVPDTEAENLIWRTISAPIPRQKYWLYLFRSKGGEVRLEEKLEDMDENDTGTPVLDNENEGEGSVPWYIPPANLGHMGVFVVINLTKDQDVDYVQFASSLNSGAPGYRKYRINNEPRRNDQQGIALGMGSWAVHVAYTTRDGTQREIGPRNAMVMPKTNASQSVFNYMYFYKTSSGNYDISFERPTDLDPEDNIVVPPDTDGYGRSLIRIVNRTSNHTVQRVNIIDPGNLSGNKLIIDPVSFTPGGAINPNSSGSMAVIGTERFTLRQNAVYLIQIELEGGGGTIYADYYRVIKDQYVLIEITQSDIGDGHTPGNAIRGARVRVVNAVARTSIRSAVIISATITGMYVFNASTPDVRVYYDNGIWDLPGPIDMGSDAELYVLSNPTVPIVSGQTYKAILTVVINGVSWETKEKNFSPDGLYGVPDKTRRTVTLTSSDVNDIVSAGYEPYYFMYQALYDGIILVPVERFDGNDNYNSQSENSGNTGRRWAFSGSDFDLENFRTRYPGSILRHRSPPTVYGGTLYGMLSNYIYEGDPVLIPLVMDKNYYVFFIKKESSTFGGIVDRVYGYGPATEAGNTLFLLNLREYGLSFQLRRSSGSGNNPPDNMWSSKILVTNPSGTMHRTSPHVVINAFNNNLFWHNVANFRNRTDAAMTIYRFRYMSNGINFVDRAGTVIR